MVNGHVGWNTIYGDDNSVALFNLMTCTNQQPPQFDDARTWVWLKMVVGFLKGPRYSLYSSHQTFFPNPGPIFPSSVCASVMTWRGRSVQYAVPDWNFQVHLYLLFRVQLFFSALIPGVVLFAASLTFLDFLVSNFPASLILWVSSPPALFYFWGGLHLYLHC